MEKILLPVDDSEESLKAVRYAVDIAENTGASLELVHVLPLTFPIFAEELVPLPAEIEEAWEKDARELLDRYKRQPHAKVQITTRIEKGDAGLTILDLAKRGRYNMIVMGARGFNWLRKMFSISISSKVVEQAPCPVLVVR